ncbi:MAG: DegV family protein [Chloroflexi bacterium]|nr:DegV family protein [Chloroflexota bacterium]
MAIRIVTDSTADLPAEVAAGLDIAVVPLYVHFGDEQLRDGVDISSEQFFERLQRESRTPTTSQPPAGVFRDLYRELSADGSEIVSIHVSSKLSGTFASAQQGAASLDGAEVRIVDSGAASMALGMAVLAAAEAAKRGESADAVVAAAEDLLARTHMLVIFDTLEYLRRGGRIGRGMELIGTLARLKPIATIRDGEVTAAGRVRTKSKAIEEVLRRFSELRPLERAGVVHATTPEESDYVAERLRGLAPGIPITQSRIGPVLGVHAGPGVLGATVVTAPADAGGSTPGE